MASKGSTTSPASSAVKVASSNSPATQSRKEQKNSKRASGPQSIVEECQDQSIAIQDVVDSLNATFVRNADTYAEKDRQLSELRKKLSGTENALVEGSAQLEEARTTHSTLTTRYSSSLERVAKLEEAFTNSQA